MTQKESIFIDLFLQKYGLKNNPSIEKLLNFYKLNAKSEGYAKKCGLEEFHSQIETSAIHLLEKLYNMDNTFFNNPKDKNAFSLFIGTQYTRTNKMRQNLINSKLSITDVDKDTLSRVFNLIAANALGNWVLNKSKLCYLINNTTVDFITGDQPIINLKADINYSESTEGTELYYPISPSLAICLTEELEGFINIAANEVKKYNDLIKQHSCNQVYSLKMF